MILKQNQNQHKAEEKVVNLLIILLFLSLSCNKYATDDTYYYKKNPNVSDFEYSRDSIYLFEMVNQFIEHKIGVYFTNVNKDNIHLRIEESKELYGITVDTICFRIDKIFYDDKKLKLLAYVVDGKAIKKNPVWEKDIAIYGGGTLIGYRNNINEPWKIYPFDISVVSGCKTEKQLIEILNYKYLHQMKDRIMGFQINYQTESLLLKYNLDDEGFWENFPYFIKDYSGFDTLYKFEINTTGTKYDLYSDGAYLMWQENSLDSNNKIPKEIFEKWRAKLGDETPEYIIKTFEEQLNIKIDSNDLKQLAFDEFTEKEKYSKIIISDSVLQLFKK